ncbi:MAG TPA: hypothetical protein VEC99_05015 [Clostridia bacterium]|nr:hypothetical protein [Clostridia bacterium]
MSSRTRRLERLLIETDRKQQSMRNNLTSLQNQSAESAALKLRARSGCSFGMCAIIGIALAFVVSLPALAQDTNLPAKPEFSAFKIITERNIFNPSRSARSTARRESRPVARTESISLVGTMSYEKGTFAFFEGSKADYRKVVKATDSFAGFTITEIAPSCVKMLSGTNEIQLSVGSQLRRQEEGGWRVAASSEMTGSSSSLASMTGTGSSADVARSEPASDKDPQNTENDSATETAATDLAVEADAPDASSSGSEASGTDDPVLKRLMQRREQELNR